MILEPVFAGINHDAEAQDNAQPLPKFAFIAVGDGTPYEPNELPNATQLVHQLMQLPILAFDDVSFGAHGVKFYVSLPPDFQAHVTEIGLLSEDGTLYAYAPYDPANNGLYKPEDAMWQMFGMYSRPNVAPLPENRVVSSAIALRKIEVDLRADVINSLNLYFFSYRVSITKGLVDMQAQLMNMQSQLNTIDLATLPMIRALEAQGTVKTSGITEEVAAILANVANAMKEPSKTVVTTQTGDGFWKFGTTSSGSRPSLPAWDVLDGQVVLLISQAGAVGTSTFVDTAKNQPITSLNAVWSNELILNKPSIYVNDGFLRIENASALNVAAGQPFCFEFWAKMRLDHAGVFGVRQFNRADNWLITADTNVINPGLGFFVSHGTNPNTWKHYALTRDWNNQIRLYVNGISSGVISNGLALDYGTAFFQIGTLLIPGAAYPTISYFAEIRFVKDNPIYTANFTPPAAGWV